MTIKGAGMGVASRLSLVDLKTGRVIRRTNSPDFDEVSHRASMENWKALGLIPSDNPGPLAGWMEETKARMGLQYRLEIDNPDGSKRDTGWVDSDSLVTGWIEMFRAQWGNTSATVTDINTLGKTVSHNVANMVAVSPGGTAAGPVLGIDTGVGQTAVDVNQTKLVSLIPQGTGNSQLSHATPVVSLSGTLGLEARIVISGSFESLGALNIDVREVGLHLSFSGNTFLVARDITLLDPEIILPAAVATLSWKIFTSDVGTQRLFRALGDLMKQSVGESGGGTDDGRNVSRQLGQVPQIYMQATEFTTIIPNQGPPGGDLTSDKLGIKVGTLDVPIFDPTDLDLGSRVTDGLGVGEMVHSPQVTGPVFTSGPNRRFVMTRAFTNVSGGAITVKETGQFYEAPATKSGEAVSTVAILGARDVLAVPFPVPDLSIVVVEFQYQV